MRADLYLFQSGYARSREAAKKLIAEGRVLVNGTPLDKPSKEIDDSCTLEIRDAEHEEYVSRGGYKLKAALDHFGIDPQGLIAADLGASSGGFCDCLLRRGIRRIYAVDCGHGQLDPHIAADRRVVSLEGTNARYLTADAFGETVDLTVMDLSFISQTLIYPAICEILREGGILISLIKPQFEAGRANIGKNGLVKSDKARQMAVERVLASAELFGLHSRGVIVSPIKGGDGNTEYLTVFDFHKTDVMENGHVGAKEGDL